MFSATISREVMDISWLYQRDVVEITVLPKEKNEPKIAQYSLHAEGRKGADAGTAVTTGGLASGDDFLQYKIYDGPVDKAAVCAGDQGGVPAWDIKQSVRNKVMKDFREGKFPVLVATDVAARGIDVDDIDAVINLICRRTMLLSTSNRKNGTGR